MDWTSTKRPRLWNLLDETDWGPWSDLVDQIVHNNADDVARLPASDSASLKALTSTWVEESCRIAAAPGFYPDTHKPPPDYAQQFDPVLTRRLSMAAGRLAHVLNASLAPVR